MTTENNERSKPGSLGALYDVLDAAFPGHRTRLGFLSVRRLAGEIDVSCQAVYKWFSTDTLPADKAKALIDISDDRLKIKDLACFVIK